MANELAKKLFLHKANQVLLLNPPAGYQETIQSQLTNDTPLLTSPTPVNFILQFASNSLEFKQWLGIALEYLEQDGFFWVAYPKKSSKVKSDLSRDSLVSLLHEVGQEGVSLVSIDDTWSAMWVRPRK